MADLPQPTTIYKPSKTRQIISLIVAILVLIIGVLSTVVLFHQATQGYKIVYADKPPTSDSKTAYGDLLFAPPFGSGNMNAYQVPHTTTETRNFYLGGFGSILGTIILLFLIYKYSKITEIKIIKSNGASMDIPTPTSPTPQLNPTLQPPPQKSAKSKGFTIFIYALLVIVIAVIAYIVFSIFVARAISRDAKRRADIMQLQAGLELYLNDHNNYPDSLAELTQPYKGQPYIGTIPVAPKPADGPCTEEQNTYSYKKTSSGGYELTYCIGRGGQLKNFLTGQITTVNPGMQTVQENAPINPFQNTTPTPIPTPTPQTINPSNLQTYQGAGFFFKYPASWVVSSTGNPSKNPTSCGDAWGDAASCLSLDPQELAKSMAGTVHVILFSSSAAPLSWCQSKSELLTNCSLYSSNGHSYITASPPSGSYPKVQYKIISVGNTILVFQLTNNAYQAEFDVIVDSAY